MNYDTIDEGLLNDMISAALVDVFTQPYTTGECITDLMEDMQRRGYDLITWYSRSDKKWCAAVAPRDGVDYYWEGGIDTGLEHLSEADTLPVAVCRTVLKALDGERNND